MASMWARMFVLGWLIMIVTACGNGGSTTATAPAVAGGGGGGGGALAPQQIVGVVDDDPVAGATVYVQFADDDTSTKAQTDAQGRFTIVLTQADMAKIQPQVPDGADGPKDELFLVAEKDGRKLRTAIKRDLSDANGVYITNETEAYARFLEAVGTLTASGLIAFKDETQNGRVKQSSQYYNFIKDVAENVKRYFMQGWVEPSSNDIFNTAMEKLPFAILKDTANSASIFAVKDVMAGGKIKPTQAVQSVQSLDGLSVTPQSDGSYQIGSDLDSKDNALFKIQLADGTWKIATLNVKPVTKINVLNANVTPQDGAVITSNNVTVSIPPFALSEQKEITIKKVMTEGNTQDGRVLLKMEPAGLNFDLPINITLNYAEFNVDNPYSVSWEYGDGTEYKKADIISVDETNKNVTLSIDHFSDLIVRRVSTLSFLDLGHNFVVHIPRRDLRYAPTDYNENLIGQSSVIISNRLLPKASVSNLNGVRNYGGGQCVQFAFNFYIPLKLNFRPTWAGGLQADKLLKNSEIFRKDNNSDTYTNIRAKYSDCQEGDIVAMANESSVGHIGIFKAFHSDNKTHQKVLLIQSNGLIDGTFPKRESYVSKDGLHHERFSIDLGTSKDLSYRTDNMSTYTKDYSYVCIKPEAFKDNNTRNDSQVDPINNYKKIPYNEKFNTSYNNSGGRSVTHRPWLYYMLDMPNNRIFDPDLFPVAPLRISYYDNNTAKTMDLSDARYEVYVSSSGAKFDADSMRGNPADTLKVDNVSLKFNGDTFYRLIYDHNNASYTDMTQLKMLDSYGNSRRFTASQNQDFKMLFSPTVIDDYYVSWNNTFKLGCDDKDTCIRIGFKNSLGYDVRFDNTSVDNNSPLTSGRVYRHQNAVNGYFLALGKQNGTSQTAKWAFALAGPHDIYVNLPLGLRQAEKNAVYRLYKQGQNPIELRFREDERAVKISNSNFLWYQLCDINNKDNCTFDFTGTEYLEVTTDSVNPMQIDAIRLMTKETIIADGEVVTKILAEGANNTQVNFIAVIQQNIQQSYNTIKQISTDGILKIGNLVKGLYKMIIKAVSPTTNTERQGQSLRTMSSTINPDDYQPEIVFFTIDDQNKKITLPEILLKKKGKKDTTIRVIDALTGSAISNASLTVRFGLDRADNTIAFSGITDSNGKVTFNQVPYGQYTVEVTKSGYQKLLMPITVSVTSQTQIEISASPILQTGQSARIILSWGENPSDLDSHLIKTKDGQQLYHIYFGQEKAGHDNLDRDDIDGFGPETVTIESVDATANYTYFVHHYAGSGNIASSGASVKLIYNDQVWTFYPPADDTTYKYWKVFNIQNGQVIRCTQGCVGSSQPQPLSLSDDTSEEVDIMAIIRSLPTKP